MKYFIIFSVFLIDQFLKFIVVVNMEIGQSIDLLPFLDITYLKNTGMAFSLLRGHNNILLGINMIILFILTWLVKYSDQKDKLMILAYSFILGGALSNLWDRFVYDGVIDFINLKIWPVFNIADGAITIGALIIVYSIFKDFKHKRAGAKNVS